MPITTGTSTALTGLRLARSGSTISAMSERACIYVAARLAEGKRVEEVLTRTGIDYAVEIAPKTIRLLGLFPTRYRRAVFYVAQGRPDAAVRPSRQRESPRAWSTTNRDRTRSFSRAVGHSQPR